jgi:hypothetical protein
MHGWPCPYLWDPAAMKTVLAPGLLLLAACASRQPVLPEVPKTVTVVVEKYVTVPDDLTAACPVYEPREQSYSEAKRLALIRRESLVQCNKQMERIRALGEEKP